MNNEQTFLFVGGPVDGQRIAVPEPYEYYKFPVLPQHPTVADYEASVPFVSGRPFGIIMYTARKINGTEGHRRVIFAPEYLSGNDVLDALVACYRPTDTAQ